MTKWITDLTIFIGSCCLLLEVPISPLRQTSLQKVGNHFQNKNHHPSIQRDTALRFQHDFSICVHDVSTCTYKLLNTEWKKSISKGTLSLSTINSSAYVVAVWLGSSLSITHLFPSLSMGKLSENNVLVQMSTWDCHLNVTSWTFHFALAPIQFSLFN